jgi:hypothetical protein
LIELAKARAAQERARALKAEEGCEQRKQHQQHQQQHGRSKPGEIIWLAGDMLDASFGQFDHVLAMDSLIHYGARIWGVH